MGEALLVRSVAGSPAVSDVFTLTNYTGTFTKSFSSTTSTGGNGYEGASSYLTFVDVSASMTPLVKILINSITVTSIYNKNYTSESWSNVSVVSSATTKRLSMGQTLSFGPSTSNTITVNNRQLYCRVYVYLTYTLNGYIQLKFVASEWNSPNTSPIYAATIAMNCTVTTCEPKGLF